MLDGYRRRDLIADGHNRLTSDISMLLRRYADDLGGDANEGTWPVTTLARSPKKRKSDVLHRLEHDKELWAASADFKGVPHLVPLSFWWDGKHLFVATARKNPTARNMVDTGHVRVALGCTRDVVLINAVSRLLGKDELSKEYGDAYVAKCGWDPRASKTYQFFRLEPRRVECWREWNEHADREVMRDGQWLA
jgi:hypothetical protein